MIVLAVKCDHCGREGVFGGLTDDTLLREVLEGRVLKRWRVKWVKSEGHLEAACVKCARKLPKVARLRVVKGGKS